MKTIEKATYNLLGFCWIAAKKDPFRRATRSKSSGVTMEIDQGVPQQSFEAAQRTEPALRDARQWARRAGRARSCKQERRRNYKFPPLSDDTTGALGSAAL